MDDSERSYGYSEDIYHGSHPDAEKSYEYGPEKQGGEAEGSELSPEEEAIHIEGNRNEEPVSSAEAGEYDYSRDEKAPVESFTWAQEPEAAGKASEK